MKIVQIAPTDNYLYALDEHGRIWKYGWETIDNGDGGMYSSLQWWPVEGPK
jgi:hypothetical protein